MQSSTNLSIIYLDISTNVSIGILDIFHKQNHQDFRNLDGAILWRLKHIVSHERLNFEYNPNAKGYWYNVMVKWVTGETITQSTTIMIGGDTVTCAFYAYDGQEKGSDINQEGFPI